MSTLLVYASQIGVCSAFILLVVLCGLCKRKKDKAEPNENVEEKSGPELPAAEAAGASQMKPTSHNGQGSVRKESTRAAPPNLTKSSKPESQRAVGQKSNVGPDQLNVISEEKKASGLSPMKSAMGKSARPPPPPPMASPAPPPMAGINRMQQSKRTKSPGGADPKTLLESMIAPRVGGPKAPDAFPAAQKPNMEFISADDPAYRSLVGLDDAFGSTHLAKAESAYATKTKRSAGSVMPSARGAAGSAMPGSTGSVTTPKSEKSSPGSPETSHDTSSDKEKRKGGKGKKKEKKKKKKK